VRQEGTIRGQYSVSTSYTSLGMNFSTAAFPDSGPQPNSWADFWDTTKFPGKRTMPFCGVLEGDWPLPEAALLADGIPADKLYPLDIERAVRKLKELAPNVIWWKNTSQPGQYLVSGEAVMAMDSVGRTNNLIDKGAPVKYVWNGAQTFSSKWIVAKGDPNYDNAMRFLAFVARPDRQIELAKLIGYAPINPRAYETMDPVAAKRLVTYPDNFKNTFPYDYKWWAANLSKWTEAWSFRFLHRRLRVKGLPPAGAVNDRQALIVIQSAQIQRHRNPLQDQDESTALASAIDMFFICSILAEGPI